MASLVARWPVFWPVFDLRICSRTPPPPQATRPVHSYAISTPRGAYRPAAIRTLQTHGSLHFPTRYPLTSGSRELLRTNLKYANRKILISLFLYYVSIFTLSHIYNAQMTYAASCFSTKYLLPLLSLLTDPKYAVVPSCLFLSLIRVCDDNLQAAQRCSSSFCFLHVPMMCPVMCRGIV